jgi:hypothetical protein
MALMDMANIEPLAAELPRLLSQDGRFVFCVLHPCFNGTGARRVVEEQDDQGALVERAGVFVYRYLTSTKTKGFAIAGQPQPQLYFERPISALFQPFLKAGMVIEALEEPTFPLSVPSNRPMSPIRFREIPFLLAARMVPKPARV